MLNFQEKTIKIKCPTYGDFQYALFSEAYDINQKKGCYIKELLSWGVAASKEETLYYAHIMYQDFNISDEKKDLEVTDDSKQMMWFELVVGNTKDELEENISSVLDEIKKSYKKTVKEVKKTSAPRCEPYQHIAIIIYTEISNPAVSYL